MLTSHRRHVQVDAIKTMFDSLIDRHAEAYLSTYPEVKDFSNYERSGTFNYYIGMVWTDDYEKPDTEPLRIRGSSSISKNKIIELDLSAVDAQQSFFPGQIVAFLAEPFQQRLLRVTKFLDPMRIAPPMKKINMTNKVSLLVASGPFVKQDQDNWTLFESIIENVKSKQATHLLLIGPFVEFDNKPLRDQYDVNWRLVLDKLIGGLHDHECEVYIISSVRDVLPSFLDGNYFYPSQGIKLDSKLKEGVKPKCSVYKVSDPAQLCLDGIYVDATSAEILFDMNKCTSFVNKASGISFTLMHRHLVTHGIYPIYPPPPKEMAVDYLKLHKHIQLDRLGPHMIVIPSRFSLSAANNVENRLVVTINKCSIKKNALFIEIPKTESSDERPIDSLVLTDYKQEIIDLTQTDSQDMECSQ